MKRSAKHQNIKKPSSAKFDIATILHLVFVPSAKNQYRPHLVRSWTLVFIFVAFLTGQLVATHTQGTVLADTTTIPPSALLDSTNAIRARAGVRPLAINAELTAAAAAKAHDMFAEQYWDHVSPSGIQPWYWVTKAGYTYSAAGENLARNFYKADTTVQAWYDSPPHRENLLNQHYSDVGFATISGVLEGKQATITVALYAEPLDTSVVLASAPKATFSPNNFTSSGVDTPLGLADKASLAIQSMPPLVVGVLVLLGLMLAVLMFAHNVRHHLPVSRSRRHLYRNHALIKGLGVFALIVTTFWLYSGGQV